MTLRESLHEAIRKPYLADRWLMEHGERLLRFADRVEAAMKPQVPVVDVFTEIRAALDELNDTGEP